MRRHCRVPAFYVTVLLRLAESCQIHGTRRDELACRSLHRYTAIMADRPGLSYPSATILQALNAGYFYGYTVMEATGLPSGTVYPALRRLEGDQLIRSHWERQSVADAALRPPRRYY